MGVQAVSALLAALLILAIGTSVLLRSRSDRMYTSFAAFTFTVSAWYLCTFIGVASSSRVMGWLALWSAATIPPIAIRFFRIFLAQPSIGGPKRGPRVTLAWTLLAYAGLIVSAIYKPNHAGRYIHEGRYFLVPFGVYVFGGLYRCVYDLCIQYRATTKRVERTRVGYLALGGFVATTLTLTHALPQVGVEWLGVEWSAVGNVLGILYLYFLSQTLFRYRLIDLNELLGKMAVLGTLVVLLWAVYGLLLYWIGGGQKGLYLLNALVASFVILILFEPVRSWLENGINRWLLRQRTELRGRIDAVRRELPGVVDVLDMVQRITTALEESRRVTDASVYLLDADGAGFDRAGYIGQAPPERLDANAERPLLDRVRGGYLDRDQLMREADELAAIPQSDARRVPVIALYNRLDELRAGVIFPLLGSAETEQGPWLLGLFCMRDDRTENAFDADDLDTFRQLANGAARVIESSQAYERVKERDRLAALGEMAAGLAHEIRNPLGAIKGAAQLLITAEGAAPPTTGSATETRELLEIIVEEANRLNNVVTRFLDYARSERPGREGAGQVDLNQVVRKTVQLLHQDLHKSVEIRVRIDEMLPSIAGDPESLMQVFLNLGQNALQAMPDGGTLEILTTRRRRSRLGYGQFAEVRFRDTGIGIPRDKLKKLFIPFYTTKQKGTGLGLAISHRIINQHGGTIEVRSTLGQGSTFSVFLPAAEQIPAGEVKDITETGGLRPLKAADRTDPTPPSTNAASTAHAASASSAARTAGATAAVATVGTQVESILPGDPLADSPSMDTSTSSGDLAPPATGEPAVVSLDPSADGPGTAPPVTGEAAGERP
ncbi:MAG TPA: ATP-binding protein [Kofleriaceae bacterium]|jgi:signal transduction histidine kinase|nr:ATP-binding protein [Kofleriaceae bacterium]